MSAHTHGPVDEVEQSKLAHLDTSNAYNTDASGVRRPVEGYTYTEELFQELGIVAHDYDNVVFGAEAGVTDQGPATWSDSVVEPAESDPDPDPDPEPEQPEPDPEPDPEPEPIEADPEPEVVPADSTDVEKNDDDD